MEILYIAGAFVVLLGFAAIYLARTSENKTSEQHDLAKAELERAKTERELAIVQSANDRALALTSARDNTLAQIMSADLASKNLLLGKIEERGGLVITFGDGNNKDDKGVPRISWKWTPFENAVIKIFRNEGTILETISMVDKKANLVHVEPNQREGSYQDKEARAGKTYNYYAFIETRRTGIRAEPITLDLPAEVRTGKVIDEYGLEITEFKTVRPHEYEEPFYHGFVYRRITVEKYLDGRAKKKESLDNRRADIELVEEEKELERLEREVGLRGGTFDAKHIQQLIEEAKRMTDRVGAIEKAETMLDGMGDIDERQREIILQLIRKNMHR